MVITTFPMKLRGNEILDETQLNVSNYFTLPSVSGISNICTLSQATT